MGIDKLFISGGGFPKIKRSFSLGGTIANPILKHSIR